MGCFMDYDMDRDLPQLLYYGSENTVEKCVETCKNYLYHYAGMQEGGKCFCGNQYGKHNSQVPQPDYQCSIICTGDPDEYCGNTGFNSIYNTKVFIPFVTYNGCFLNWNLNSNQLPLNPDSNALDSCSVVCNKLGYIYAGLQSGGLCTCGNLDGSNADNASLTEIECTTPCFDNMGMMCMSTPPNAIYLIYECMEHMGDNDLFTPENNTVLHGVDGCEDPCVNMSDQIRLNGTGLNFTSKATSVMENIAVMFNNSGIGRIDTVVVYAATHDSIIVGALDSNSNIVALASGYTNEHIDNDKFSPPLSGYNLWGISIIFNRDVNATYPIDNVRVSIKACLGPRTRPAAPTSTSAITANSTEVTTTTTTTITTTTTSTPTSTTTAPIETPEKCYAARQLVNDSGGMLTLPSGGFSIPNMYCTWKIATDDPFASIQVVVQSSDVSYQYSMLEFRLPNSTLLKTISGWNYDAQTFVLPYNHVAAVFRTSKDENYNYYSFSFTYTFRHIPSETYLGCFADKPMPERDLPYEVDLGFSNSVQHCVEHCSTKKYRFAGVQSSFCYCGNDYGKLDGGNARSDSECLVPCAGNKNDYCGGVWRNSIYLVLDPSRSNTTESKKLTSIMETYGKLRGYNIWLKSNLNFMINDQMEKIKAYIPQSSIHRSPAHVINGDYVRNNLVLIEIFYNELRYQSLQKQWDDSTVSLICDLGGTLGLWLGASLMSIYEIIDFIICLLLMKCR